MIGRLNHVAMRCGHGKATAVYRRRPWRKCLRRGTSQPNHGVTTVFITLPNTKIELLEPLGEDSPIANS